MSTSELINQGVVVLRNISDTVQLMIFLIFFKSFIYPGIDSSEPTDFQL